MKPPKDRRGRKNMKHAVGNTGTWSKLLLRKSYKIRIQHMHESILWKDEWQMNNNLLSLY